MGALVPASVMSIAADKLFTRNIYKESLHRGAREREETTVARWASFVLKFGAVLFIVYIPTQQVINFQLLGRIWILQTLPSVFLGLYTHWFNRWALLIGSLVADVLCTTFFVQAALDSVYTISLGSFSFPAIYIAFSMFVLNLFLSIILTPIFHVIA